MGIGRRAFLRLFGASIAVATTSPLQAVVIDQDLYLNQPLGIALKKPKNWQFGSIRQFKDMKSDQILKDDIDPNVEAEIRNSDDPIVILTESNVSRDEFRPSVVVYVEYFELSEGETLLNVLPNIERVYQELLEDFEHVGEPKTLQISGCDSIDYNSVYTLKTKLSSPRPIRCRSIISERKPYIYTLRMFDAPGALMDASREFNEVVRTVTYV